MAYLVRLTVRAQRDLALLFHEKNAEHSDAALKWYRGLKKAILSLEDHPGRCPATPEHPGLWHLLYGHRHLSRDLPNLRKVQTSECSAHSPRSTRGVQASGSAVILAYLGPLIRKYMRFWWLALRVVGIVLIKSLADGLEALATGFHICRRSCAGHLVHQE